VTIVSSSGEQWASLPVAPLILGQEWLVALLDHGSGRPVRLASSVYHPPRLDRSHPLS
jgi:hypothetical protein